MKINRNKFDAYVFFFLGIIGIACIIIAGPLEDLRKMFAVCCVVNLSWIMYSHCWLKYDLEELKNGDKKQD